MNVWLIASLALTLLLVPCAVAIVRGDLVDRLVALEAASTIAVLDLLTIEEGLQRQSFFDLSLALAVLSVTSTLLFASFRRRWL